MPVEAELLLIQAIRSGGTTGDAAYRQLVDEYEGRLRAYIRRRLRDAATVDDVVQDTFIGFVRGLQNYDADRSLQSWLFTIAAHKLTDVLRKSGRNREESGAPAGDDTLLREMDVRQRAASSILRSQEQIELETKAIRQGLSELIAELRKAGKHKRILVLELLFVKGMPNREIAAGLKISEQDVANYRHAAVNKLNLAMRNADLPTDVFPELKDEE